MTSISHNLSGRIDSSLVEVLQGINEVATALGIRFFVVGAMARIIVLESCHAIQSAKLLPPSWKTKLRDKIDIGWFGI